jgi:hypothetical protein
MITFGKPGDLRKTFNDKVFDLLGGSYSKLPCKLAPAEPLTSVVDGKFLSPDGNGGFTASVDANRALYLVFTAHTELIVKEVVFTDDFPGEDRTDTPTGLVGTIEACWPVEVLTVGPLGTGVVSLATYAANTPLTVKAGFLAPANFGGAVGDRIIGYIVAPSTAGAAGLGAPAIIAKIHV